jgi:hypothetical protein
MTVQFVEIAGQKLAMVPVGEYEQLIEAAEDRADIVAAAAAEARRQAGEEYVPLEIADRLIAGENPLRVWRTYRGMSLEELGVAVGRQPSFVSKLERGTNEGGVRLWASLARALNVSIDDLIPAG